MLLLESNLTTAEWNALWFEILSALVNFVCVDTDCDLRSIVPYQTDQMEFQFWWFSGKMNVRVQRCHICHHLGIYSCLTAFRFTAVLLMQPYCRFTSASVCPSDIRWSWHVIAGVRGGKSREQSSCLAACFVIAVNAHVFKWTKRRRWTRNLGLAAQAMVVCGLRGWKTVQSQM